MAGVCLYFGPAAKAIVDARMIEPEMNTSLINWASTGGAYISLGGRILPKVDPMCFRS